MTNLIKYDQARLALAECRNVDDVKDIRDKSEAIRLYAKQAQDTEMEQWAAEIKLRAQRAIGAISATLEKKSSRHATLPAGGKCKAEALAEAGISTSAAHRYEQLAAIPEPEIEAFIASSREVGKPVSAKAVLAAAKPATEPKRPKPPKPSAPPTVADVDIEPEPEVATPRLTPEQGEVAVTRLEELLAENAALREELDDLKQDLAETLADNEMMARVFESDDQVKASMIEVARYRALAENAERTLDARTHEFNERARNVAYWKKRAEKAEKLLGEEAGDAA